MPTPLGELFKNRSETASLPAMGKVMFESMGPQEQEQAETDPLFAAMLGRVQRVSAQETGHTTFNEFFKERVSARDLLADAFAGFAAQSVGQKHLGLRDQLFGEFQQERALNQQKQQFQQKLALDLAQTHQQAIDRAETRRIQALREGRAAKTEDQIAELRALQIDALDQRIKYAETAEEREAAQKTRELQIKRLNDLEKSFIGSFKTAEAKSLITALLGEKGGDYASRLSRGEMGELREILIQVEEKALDKAEGRKARFRPGDPPANPQMITTIQDSFRNGSSLTDVSKFADKDTIATAITSIDRPFYSVPRDVRQEISNNILDVQHFGELRDLVMEARSLGEQVTTRSGFLDRIDGFVEGLKGRYGVNAAANVLAGITGLSATHIAKSIGGDSGRLSDQDRQMAAKALPQLGDTPEELAEKTRVIQAMGLRRAFNAVISQPAMGGKPKPQEILEPAHALRAVQAMIQSGEFTNLTDALVDFVNEGNGIQ